MGMAMEIIMAATRVSGRIRYHLLRMHPVHHSNHLHRQWMRKKGIPPINEMVVWDDIRKDSDKQNIKGDLMPH